MRVGDRSDAKSTHHAARRWDLDVVRSGHGSTSQLTLGRSPDFARGRPPCGPVGGGGGTPSCRRVVGIRPPSTTRPQTSAGGLNQEDGHRPPSPARAAVSTANIVVAGEGRGWGWGNNKLSSGRWHKTAINHTPPNPGGRPQLGVRRVRRLPMRCDPRHRSAGAGSRTRTIPKPRFAFFENRSTKQTPTPRERPSVRERGRSDRTSALTAWEDGGSAVLQADTARRGLAACGGWRSHANDRTTTCCSPTPSPPPR